MHKGPDGLLWRGHILQTRQGNAPCSGGGPHRYPQPPARCDHTLSYTNLESCPKSLTGCDQHALSNVEVDPYAELLTRDTLHLPYLTLTLHLPCTYLTLTLHNYKLITKICCAGNVRLDLNRGYPSALCLAASFPR